MDNIFKFSYQESYLKNLDDTPSRFRGVYGDKGNLINVPKGERYNIIQTEDVSVLASVFQDNGLNVTPFVFKDGEVIGIDVPMGERMSKVGDRQVSMRLTIKNNGTGVGYASAFVKRLICTNGAVRTEFAKDRMVKIPHTKDYNIYLKIAQDSILTFKSLLQSFDEQDLLLDGTKLDKIDLMFHLNKWFFDFEFPDSQKGKMKFNEFRLLLVEEPEKIKPIDRYRELMSALDREVGYNTELKLDLSMYTAYAAVSNYLSRRVEKSGSAAPIEIVQERAFDKLSYFAVPTSTVVSQIEEAVLV